MTQFDALGLTQVLLRALAEEGYSTPTPIQQQAIGPVLRGRDVLGCAQTGTGKTAAFALPILQRLLTGAIARPPRGPAQPRALILAPTRELATQIGESFAAYGRHTALRQAVIFGGVSQFHQVRALRDGVDILVATPGRLLDLMEQRVVNLAHVGVFVLDEADRMLDMGFIAPIRRIAAALPQKADRQTLLFSATMPREVTHLAEALLHDPVRVAVTPVSTAAPLIEQSVYMVPRPKKQALLRHLLAEHRVERALVFTRTKHGAERLSRQLQSAGIAADAIHGNKAQNQRRRALANFRDGSARVLVATDVAARGLDVDGITHVFNYDLPDTPESYVHRIGRTGRAGAAGVAMSFCDGEERDLLQAIEKLIGQRVPSGGALPELPDAPATPATQPREAHRESRPRRAAPRAHAHASSAPASPAREPQRSWTRRVPSGRGGRRRG